MQKTQWLLCLSALVGVGSPSSALAASSVGITGYLDLGLYRDFDGDRQVGTIKRSSITFSGSEDLGGGTSVIFKLQHRFDLNNGAIESGGKPFWHGESTVGLKSPYGTVRIGRALNVVSNNDWAFDPWDNFDRIASPAWNNWHWNFASDRTSNSGAAEYGRLSNGVFYDSPQWSGLSIHLSGDLDGHSGSDKRNNGGIAVNYHSGPAGAMAAYSNNSSGDSVKFLAGSWQVQDLKVMTAWSRSVFTAATDSVADVVTLGLSYPIGRTTLKAGWGRRDVDDSINHFLGLGASYTLSDRSSLYLSVGRSDPQASSAQTAAGVGMSHSF